MARDEVGRMRAAMWGVPFVTGLLIAALGLVALGWSFAAGIASIVYVGAVLVIGGALEIVRAFRDDRPGSPALYLLSGILTVVAGVMLIARPLAGLAVATILLAAYFFASGLFRSITSAVDRYRGWGWDLAYGLSAIVLGIVALSQFPASSLYLVGILVGLELFFRGISIAAATVAIRRTIEARTSVPF